jgi:hypothetical protein
MPHAKYLRERTNEPNPLDMANAIVPADLGGLIEGCHRALDAAHMALD